MILIASDHGGFGLKNALKDHLTQQGCEVEDLGVHTPDSVDYPDIAEQLCKRLLSGTYEFGILICGTGIGISMAANKIDGIRCALVRDEFSARMAKQHNNANVLALGGRVTGDCLAASIVDAYRAASFEGGRHAARVEKIHRLEQ